MKQKPKKNEEEDIIKQQNMYAQLLPLALPAPQVLGMELQVCSNPTTTNWWNGNASMLSCLHLVCFHWFLLIQWCWTYW